MCDDYDCEGSSKVEHICTKGLYSSVYVCTKEFYSSVLVHVVGLEQGHSPIPSLTLSCDLNSALVI